MMVVITAIFGRAAGASQLRAAQASQLPVAPASNSLRDILMVRESNIFE
jgi:hypothetical protein